MWLWDSGDVIYQLSYFYSINATNLSEQSTGRKMNQKQINTKQIKWIWAFYNNLSLKWNKLYAYQKEID